MPVLGLPDLKLADGLPPRTGPAVFGSDPTADERLGRYRLDGVLGKGGCAVVYRAWDLVDDRAVALKVARRRPDEDDGTAAARLLDEGTVLRRVACPAIVTLFDSASVGGRAYLALQLADRGSLGTRLRAGTVGGARATARVGATLAGGLSRIHAMGLVHRDVTPANLLITGPGTPAVAPGALVAPDERVLLADLGIAAPAGSVATGARLLVGRPLFSAPEMRARTEPVGPPADVYSATAVVVSVVSGRMPPTAGERDALLAGLPPRWRAFVATGMDSDPARRFPTIEDWHEALVDAIDDDRDQEARRGGG